MSESPRSSPSRQGSEGGAEEGGDVLLRGWHRALVGALSLREVVEETQLWAATWGREVSEVLPHFSTGYLTDSAARVSAGYQHHAAAPNPAQDQGNYVGSVVVHLLLLAPPQSLSSPTPFGGFFHADTVDILLREQRGRPTSSKGPANYRTNFLEAFELHLHRIQHGLHFVALLARLQELVLRLVVYCCMHEGLAWDAPDAVAARALAPFVGPSSAREAPAFLYDEDASAAFLAAYDKHWQREAREAALDANDADMRRHFCSQPSLLGDWDLHVGLAARSGQWRASVPLLKALVPRWSEQQCGVNSFRRVWEAEVRSRRLRAEEEKLLLCRLDGVLVPSLTVLRDERQMSRLVRAAWEAHASSSRAARTALQYKCLRVEDSSRRTFKSLRKARQGSFLLRMTVHIRKKDCSTEVGAEAARRRDC